MKSIKLINQTVLSSVLVACGIVISPLSVGASSLGGDGAMIACPYLPDHLAEDPPLCDGKPATCVGTDGHDLIWGSDSVDVIVAGAGNDVIQGDAGDDTICGGDGNDAIHGARGDDTLFGEEGDDFVFGAVDNDVLWGGAGDFDVLFGGPGHDRLDGGPGKYDVCMKQREGAEVNIESCETIYPPMGYRHDEEHELGTGIIGPR